MRSFIATAILAALLTAGCATNPAPHAGVVAAPPEAPPPSDAPRPASFLWLDMPSATPMLMLGVIEYTGPDEDAARSAVLTLGLQVQAQGALRVPDSDLLRPEVGFGHFGPNLSVSHPERFPQKSRWVLFRFGGPSPFVRGMYHPTTGQFLSGEEPSLFRIDQTDAVTTFGRYVRSPYAADKPLISVVGLPDGAAVICPYTNKPFVLW